VPSSVDEIAARALDVPRPASLWRNRDFTTFWVGETLSLLGAQVTALALPLTAIEAFNASDQLVGVLRFVELAPYIGLALLFGVWADRLSRRKVMLWTNIVRMALVTAVPVLHWLGVLTMPILLVIACAVGIASVLFDVSWMPLVPALVRDHRHQVQANARVGVSQSVADIAGPGLAGVLIVVLSAPVALIVDAASYVASVLSLSLIRAGEAPRPASAERHLLRELREGLNWVFGKPVLRWLALVGFCCNFSMMSVWTMFLLYATRGLHLRSFTIGAIFAAASVGGLIGAATSARIMARFPIGKTYFVAQTGLLLGPALIVLAAGPEPVLVAMLMLSFFVTDLGLGVVNVIIVSLRQTATPQSIMSRMTACFRMLMFGGGALGALTGGFLAGAIGPRSALIVAAVASAGVIIALLYSPVSRLRELPPAAVEAPSVPTDGHWEVSPGQAGAAT
jgi:MFS family permease